MRKDRGSKLRFVRPLLGSLQVTGNIDNLPKGGVLVIINHTSLIDPFIVYLVLRKIFGRNVSFMATDGLWKYPILGSLLKWHKFIPVNRKSNNPASALAHAEKALRAGQVVAIYPEGGIPIEPWMGTEDQLPSKFKTGAARLWAETKVPVLPIAQLGARHVMSGGKWKQVASLLSAWLRRFTPNHKIRLHVHVGELIEQNATGNVDEDTNFLRNAVLRAFEEAKSRAS